jgi:hypothetical protein
MARPARRHVDVRTLDPGEDAVNDETLEAHGGDEDERDLEWCTFFGTWHEKIGYSYDAIRSVAHCPGCGQWPGASSGPEKNSQRFQFVKHRRPRTDSRRPSGPDG